MKEKKIKKCENDPILSWPPPPKCEISHFFFRTRPSLRKKMLNVKFCVFWRSIFFWLIYFQFVCGYHENAAEKSIDTIQFGQTHHLAIVGNAANCVAGNLKSRQYCQIRNYCWAQHYGLTDIMTCVDARLEYQESRPDGSTFTFRHSKLWYVQNDFSLAAKQA